MPTIQETLRAVLGADLVLTAIVGDRIFPGDIPDDEPPAPWVLYTVPESNPIDDLDGADTDVESEVDFDIYADTYAEAVAIVAAITDALKTYSGGDIKRALWAGTTEDVTEDGHHHAARFRMWWVLTE